jgi:hypothetical protein
VQARSYCECMLDLSFSNLFRCVHKTAKSDYSLRLVRPSVPPFVLPSVFPHGTTLLPLDGFSWDLIFKYFSKICWENSSFIKIWHEQRVFYMKTYVHLWQYLAEFFLEWEVFQTKAVEKIKTHLLLSVTFSKNRAVYEIIWKDSVEPDRRQMKI